MSVAKVMLQESSCPGHAGFPEKDTVSRKLRLMRTGGIAYEGC
jgi:hypothetical protein